MQDTSDQRFMRQALGQAKLALTNNWIPVGAVFVKDDRIVAHACKTGTNHALFDHAEHNGCYQALWSREGPRNLEGFSVYSTMEPCVMCMSMLMTTRVSRIVYGIGDPYGGGGFMLSYPQYLPARFQSERPVLIGGVLEKESAALLREFFSKEIDARNWSDRDNPLVRHVMERAG